MSRNSYFKNLSFSVILVIFVLSAVILIAAVFFSAEVFRAVFIAAGVFLTIFLLLLLTGFIYVSTSMAYDDERNVKPLRTGFSPFFMTIALRLYMPFLLFASNILNYRKDEIRKVFIEANNRYVLSLVKKVRPEKLLVLLPHCLQWSECSHRIREGLNECRQCCKCTLGTIKDLVKKFGINVALATGGTSARKAVKELNPDLVVAIACERDLSSGILDVRDLPVYGIINMRPNGPCKDTLVDTGELEEIIRYFTDEKE